MRSDWNSWMLFVFLAASQAGTATLAAESRDLDYGPAVRRAVALLPTRPVQVLVINVNDAKPEDREYLSRLQAFIIKGSSVIYLTGHGEVLQAARQGSRFHDYLLAPVIRHEMAHVDGADESEARRREESLWTTFILEYGVDRDTALRYLSTLKKRPSASLH
jgi:hypothetical protein